MSSSDREPSFRNRSKVLVDSIAKLAKTVRPENVPYLSTYLGEDGLDFMRMVVKSIDTDMLVLQIDLGDETEELDALIKERRRADLSFMKGKLAVSKYQLQDQNTVFAVMGTQSVEVVSITYSPSPTRMSYVASPLSSICFLSCV